MEPITCWKLARSMMITAVRMLKNTFTIHFWDPLGTHPAALLLLLATSHQALEIMVCYRL
jgi:hypothetical protein